MKTPDPINLVTPAAIRAQGWQAESRDDDGHLMATHVTFESDDDIAWFVRTETKLGHTVTIWPAPEKD